MQDPPPLARFQAWLAPALAGPPLLAFLPALSLGAFWLGGERALVLTSLGLPLLRHRRHLRAQGSRARPRL